MTLNTYLTDRYTAIGNQLGWTSDDFNVIVEDTLETIGVSSEAEETNLIKLHAIAIYLLWKKALETVTLDFNFSADGASYSRSDMHSQILKNLEIAESEALAYMPYYQVEMGTLTYIEDPYSYSSERDEAGNY